MYALGVQPEIDAHAKRIGSALEAVRLYRKMSQDEVALRAETSASTLSRYERGLTSASAYTVLRLAQALQVPVELLVDPPEDREDVFIAVARHDKALRGQARSEELPADDPRVIETDDRLRRMQSQHEQHPDGR